MSLECEICGKLICFGHEEEPAEAKEETTETKEQPKEQPEVKVKVEE